MIDKEISNKRIWDAFERFRPRWEAWKATIHTGRSKRASLASKETENSIFNTGYLREPVYRKMSNRSAYVHLFYLAALLYVAAASCKEGSETDCSLNGVCWTGDRCNHLKLRPPGRAEPHGYFNGTILMWGGDVIYENGTYHGFVHGTFTTPPFNESDNYECHTAIVRLEGETPAGSFRFIETIIPAFHHEAHAIRAPDGTVLISVQSLQ